MIRGETDMKTAILTCCFTISLLLVLHTHIQAASAAERDQLDSLLLAGSPGEAVTYWSTVCSEPTEDTVATTACVTTTDLLQDLLNFVGVFERNGGAGIEELIADGRTQSARYHEEYAGKAADRAFRKFLVSADAEAGLGAITYLRIARLFKILYVKKTLYDAHRCYTLADGYLAGGDYEAAAGALDSIQFAPGNNSLLLAYADTINFLRQRVDRKLSDIAKHHDYWERTAAVARRLRFSLMTRLNNQPGSNAFPLVMSNANSTIMVEVKRVSPSFRPGAGLQAWYQVGERLSVGAGVAASRFTYSSVHTPQFIFFEFDVSYYSAFLGGQYLFRSEVGMRPYMSLALGGMRYKYDQFNCIVQRYQAPNGAPVPEEFLVSAGTFSTGEATVTLGLQYVPRHNSWWAISSEISLSRPFDKHEFLPMPWLAIGLQIDVLM